MAVPEERTAAARSVSIEGRITEHSGRVGLASELTARRASTTEDDARRRLEIARMVAYYSAAGHRRAGRSRHSNAIRPPRVPSAPPPGSILVSPQKHHQGAPGARTAYSGASAVEPGLSSRSHPPASMARTALPRGLTVLTAIPRRRAGEPRLWTCSVAGGPPMGHEQGRYQHILPLYPRIGR